MQHVILAHKILSKNSPRVLYGKLDIVELQNDDLITRNLPSSRFSILPGYIYATTSCPFWEKVSKAWNSLLKEINNLLPTPNEDEERINLLFHNLELFILKKLLLEFFHNGSITDYIDEFL